jgi:hypothetical protein
MTQGNDPYADLKRHRLTAETQALIERQVARVPKKIHKRQQHFVRVPWAWIECLQGASGQTYRIALILLYLHWKGNGGPIKLANGMLEVDGVPRQSKWRALTDLEQRKLIVVEHRPRKSPIIHLNLSRI